ncbi:helix-turn-helix domain-containing protein [Franconibacter daqui]|uniref:helix-turn-helix domain-containing protein n=1 Tax=Franconibacter daqui TaxID=2047724 RepID=UPI0030CD62AB
MNYRKQILNILYSEPESRAEMTRRIGVTKAYITKLTSQLLAEGLIEERDVKDAAFGRPQQLLAVKANLWFSVNIMLRRGSFQATLNDYNTRLDALASHHVTLPPVMSPAELAEIINEGINALCVKAAVSRPKLKVVSVALQGGIEQYTGVVRYCPLFAETNIDFRSLVAKTTGIVTNIYNIAHCTTYLLAKRSPGLSWVAFMPGFGSLGYGYCMNGETGLGENGFYPEIVHLPYEGGLEQAFNVDPQNKPATLLATAKALYFGICCTAPVHNIRLVIVTGELFEDYGDEIVPMTQSMLNDSANPHIREIQIRHYKTGYHYGVKGLVQLSSDSITELLS